MGVIKAILISMLVHVLFFSAFPETGILGLAYGIISFLVWSAAILFTNLIFGLFNRLFGKLWLLRDIILVALISLQLLYTLPQSDRISPYEKLRREKYPDWQTINRGLEKFGIKISYLEHKAGKLINTQTKQLKKAVERLKED